MELHATPGPELRRGEKVKGPLGRDSESSIIGERDRWQFVPLAGANTSPGSSKRGGGTAAKDWPVILSQRGDNVTRATIFCRHRVREQGFGCISAYLITQNRGLLLTVRGMIKVEDVDAVSTV
ncbi:Uu.00g021440.m01.CDS01 [Anthostomella pinea]|uniref:Uu.00g021440.m01.CDS01 n=1 Tax=Anthostomella pinea TaxID=933095 RepID=A0AAI8W0K9_9PEZI|nr:Uu.00g021440.m01.CDS01 [Anthostomella pinea]